MNAFLITIISMMSNETVFGEWNLDKMNKNTHNGHQRLR